MSRWHARLAELRASRNEAIAVVPLVQNVQNVQNPPSAPTFEHFERFEQRTEPAGLARALAEPDVRTAIIGCNGGAPRAWAEALARLDPGKPPADVPAKRWLRFVDDCGRFLDGGGAARAAALGWGPLDLSGCDRERPFARIDHMDLVWLLNGAAVVEMHRDRAIIETQSGDCQCYRRRPVEVGRTVLAWELAPEQ
jgi:hypothetical protein